MSSHRKAGGMFFAAPPPIDESAPITPTVTVVDGDGSRPFSPTTKPPSIFSVPTCGAGATNLGRPQPPPPSPPQPQPGDSVTPNNHLPLPSTNPFVCPSSIILGSASNRNVSVLPTSVTLTAIIATSHAVSGTDSNSTSSVPTLLYDLRVSFRNTLGETAAAVLSVPRLPDLLLLEEHHVCGDVKYEPRVEEKARAAEAYRQAANSSTQTATLGGDATDDAYHVRLDKVPADAGGTFGLMFYQSGGLKTRAVVEESVDEKAAETTVGTAKDHEKKRSIADLAVLPGYTCLNSPDGGVPFDFDLKLLGDGLSVVLPEDNVLSEDAKEVAELKPLSKAASLRSFGAMRSSLDILSIVRLGPEAGNAGSKRVQWKTHGGLARGTVLKVRLAVESIDDLAEGMRELSLGAGGGMTTADGGDESSLPASIIGDVDTIDGVTFDPSTGACCDSTLVDLAVPFALPPRLTRPSPKQHHIYVIVDTSGSTSLRTGDGGETFLSTAKTLLDGILRDLPRRINGLRARGSIDPRNPVALKLWNFDNDTRFVAETTIGPSATTEGATAALRCKVQSFQPGGCTNYDSWSDRLATDVGRDPHDLFSVLLVTDGGATSRANFFSSIDSIARTAAASDGHFQVDCLGYGPWLDPECVSYLAGRTGGEAVMVESLTGRGTAEKVVGLLGGSLVRAASKIRIRVDGAKLLAVACPEGKVRGGDGEGGSGRAPEATIFPFCSVPVRLGQRLQLLLLHPSGPKPRISLYCEGDASGSPMVIPWPQARGRASGADGWEVIGPTGTATEEPLSSSLLSRLSREPNPRHALCHLPLLEPAYSTPGSVHFPPTYESDRTNVTLRISLLGQVVAPSVTKGIAVATLQTALKPVPENCRPGPSGLRKRYAGVLSFEDEVLPPPPRGFQVQLQQPQGPPPPLGSHSLLGSAPSPRGFGCASFGAAIQPQGAFAMPSCAPAFPAAASAPPAACSAPLQFYSAAHPIAPSFAAGAASMMSKKKKECASPVGFRVTKPSSEPAVPGLVDWMKCTRGGLFPAEAERMKQAHTEKAARLTKKALVTKLKADVDRFLEKMRGSNLFVSSTLPLGREEVVALRDIECCAVVSGEATGRQDRMNAWIIANKTDLAALTSTLLFAASRFGMHLIIPPESTNENLAHIRQHLNWPWIDPQATFAEPTRKSAAEFGRQVVPPTKEELATRTAQAGLFTSTVRRDIYRVLLNPDHPDRGIDPAEETTGAGSSSEFRAAFVANAAKDKSPDTFAFVDSKDNIPGGFVVLDDATVNEAITNIGRIHPHALTVTCAFEDYLAQKAKKWGEKEASSLSVEFLTAFGNELTPRLDVNHRIKSAKLSVDEIHTLSTEPFSFYCNQTWLQAFQT